MWIDLACNDHRNGLFQGWFEAAHVNFGKHYDDGLEIEGPRVRVRELDGASNGWMKIGRVRVEVWAYREWYGNWCWNSYDLSTHHLRAAVNYLRLRGWRCTCGPEELYERFNGEGEITPEEWSRLLAPKLAQGSEVKP